MSNDLSWLSEPYIHDLFMQFPLPLAIMGRDGSVRLLNRRFSDTFDASCIKSDNLHHIMKDTHEHVRVPVLLQCNGCTSPVFVRTVSVENDTILVLEPSDEISSGKELVELSQRVIELEKLSSTDRLTGAWNRTHFDKTIAAELSRSTRYRQPVTLIFFDIDHFKHVNDNYGHAVGDTVLREMAKVVRKNIRASDMLFRWGGEEFVILAPATSYHSAGILAETLRVKVEKHEIEAAGKVTISLGVAEHISGESDDSWFKRVDAALYAAKNGGRNRVVVAALGSSDQWVTDQRAMILRLNWHESYDCGERTIDEEHRKLFELANTLIDAAFARNTDPHFFEFALEELLQHVVRHFADEEEILAQHHYAGLDVQQRAHRILIEHALRLRDAAAAGGATIGELVDFLADEVVAQHMLKIDREFYPLFSNKISEFDKESGAPQNTAHV